MTHAIAAFARDGCAVAEQVVNADVCAALCQLCDPLLQPEDQPRPGVRRALEREPRLVDLLARSPLTALARDVMGTTAPIVRSILFDKSPAANWLVPWHQDATIAVRDRCDVPGFGPWSLKDGEHHCRPSREVLDQIVVLRLHLDDCGPGNGPLRVIPASHREGLVSPARLDELVARGPEQTYTAHAGDVVLMRPHTIHASAKASHPARRRVLHLEFCGHALPHPLAWAEAVHLSGSAYRRA
ncbi:MAG TPA: phytanoyl-CoA dioxygenase family protein [Phycisphaerales bacterium]|nr:phytanoyl-CoA dioxygenase family protein [Phycisphaerales bacterium]